MKLHVNVIPVLLLITLSLTLRAQSDTIVQANIIKPSASKKIANPSHTKVELVYQEGYTNQGHYYRIPYIRTEGANDFLLTHNSPLLRSYMSVCPTALVQLDGWKTNGTKARRYLYGSWIAGGALGITGVAITGAKESLAPFLAFLGVGFGTAITGTLISYKYKKKAEKNLKEAFRQYNIKCYVPLPKDTIPKDTLPKVDTTIVKSLEKTDLSKNNKGKKGKKAPKYYSIIRNEPQDLNLWGFEATPVILDTYTFSPSVSAGLGAFYSFPGNARIRVNYELGLYYYQSNAHRATKPTAGTYSSYGIPSSPANDSRLEVLGSIPVINKKSKTDYRVKISNSGNILVPTISADKVIAMNLRAGLIHENKMAESISNMPLTTDKPLMTPPGGGEPLHRYLAGSSAMLNSNIVAAGIGMSVIKDLKIELKDGNLKGGKNTRSVTDLYLDMLYASSMKYGDITYYYPLSSGDQLTETLSVTSPFNKLGARFGLRREGLSKTVGTAFGAELQVKPGPGVTMRERFGIRTSFAIILAGRHN